MGRSLSAFKVWNIANVVPLLKQVNVRVQANRHPITFQPELLKQLSEALKHGGNSPVARMQAGIQLKNALYSKDANLRVQYQHRWLSFPEDARGYIKKNVSVDCIIFSYPSNDYRTILRYFEVNFRYTHPLSN